VVRRTFPLLIVSCLLALVVVVGWESSVEAWGTGAGGDPNWGSTTFGGTSTDYAGGVAVDGSGNVYTSGQFNNTVDFGAGDVTSAGGSDVFVTKHNSAGAHQWTTTWGGTVGDVGYSVAVDVSGNVYVTGYFNGTVNFGAGNVTSAGGTDVFVTKLNSSGAHQWTTTFGGTSSDRAEGLAVDGSGNVYVAGWFYATVDFGAGNVTHAGSGDVYVTKLNSSGAHQWTTTFGGTSSELARSVAVDGSGNVYVTGQFNGTLNFGAGNVTSNGHKDFFVTKLNSAGAHQWTTTFGGTSDDSGYSVAVDGSGNVYAAGYFNNTVDFGAGDVTSAGTYDVFVTKFNSSGAHQWTTTFGGTGGDVSYELAVDGSGNVHVTGYFNGTVNFGAGEVTSAGGWDVFVTKLNSSGVHQWTTTFGGTGNEGGWSVAVDGSGNVHVTGYFDGTVNFGAGEVTSAGGWDGFVVKLDSAGDATVTASDPPAPAPPPAPCPWPTATFAYQSGCVEPLRGGISVDSDGTLFTTGNLDVTGVLIDLEADETAVDVELVPGATTTGYVLTSQQRIIGFGDTPTPKDLVTLQAGETVTQLSNNRNGTYFVTSHGRVFDIDGNPYVDLSRYVTYNNIVDIKTLDSGSGILIGSDGAVFTFGLHSTFQGSLGGEGITDIVGGHLVHEGYYLLSASGTVYTFGDITTAPDITALTTKVFNTETLNGQLIDVAPAGTGLCALGADGGLFDMLGSTHNTVLRAHTNPNTTAIDTIN